MCFCFMLLTHPMQMRFLRSETTMTMEEARIGHDDYVQAVVAAKQHSNLCTRA